MTDVITIEDEQTFTSANVEAHNSIFQPMQNK